MSATSVDPHHTADTQIDLYLQELCTCMLAALICHSARSEGVAT